MEWPTGSLSKRISLSFQHSALGYIDCTAIYTLTAQRYKDITSAEGMEFVQAETNECGNYFRCCELLSVIDNL